MKDLTAQPYFGVMLTVVAYWLGMKVQKKTRLAICNGMLLAVLLAGTAVIFSDFKVGDTLSLIHISEPTRRS